LDIARWAAEALVAYGLKGQPPGTSLAVINSGKYSTAQIRRGEVTPNGEVNAVHSNFLDRLDVRFDHAIGRTKERMEIIIRIGDDTQQVCLTGAARNRNSRGGHACSFSVTLLDLLFRTGAFAPTAAHCKLPGKLPGKLLGKLLSNLLGSLGVADE